MQLLLHMQVASVALRHEDRSSISITTKKGTSGVSLRPYTYTLLTCTYIYFYEYGSTALPLSVIRPRPAAHLGSLTLLLTHTYTCAYTDLCLRILTYTYTYVCSYLLVRILNHTLLTYMYT